MNTRTSIRHFAFFILHSTLALSALCADGVQQRPRPDSPGAIRVVTANLRTTSPRDYETGNGWNQRRELCRDVLLALDADIYCFQEGRNAHLDFLKKTMPGFEHSVVAHVITEKGQPEPTGTILYSTKRFKKVRSGGFWLSDTPEKPGSRFEGSAYTRIINWVLLQDQETGRELLVWNAHLDEARGEKGAALREKQARVFLDFAGKIPSSVPQIFTGDMNTTAGSKAMRDITTAGWTDSWAALHGPADPGRTFHGFAGAKVPGKGGKIDFIFCNTPLKPLASEIVRDNRDGKYPSDHYFVMADLEYRPAPPENSNPQ